MNMLQVERLSKSFGGRPAVDGVSFGLAKGQTLGLLGPNGAGKSTTVAMICGLLRPDAGEVLFDGQAMGVGNNAVKRQIGLVPQDLALFEDLPALENLKVFGALYGLKGADLAQRCEQALALVSLSDRAKDLAGTYSGGMKRRLNIACALLHEPQLLILDEPTVGVDPQSRNAIFDSLEALKAQGRSLIYTSHYMEEVERLADHIVIIDYGKVIADDTPQALFTRLPAAAALHVDLAQPLAEATLVALKTQAGVASVTASNGAGLEVALDSNAQALPVLEWLRSQGAQPLYFATAKVKLEDVFLTLTGRSLRD
jgi:ABC-2 type transport system ATP-binding protein